MSIKSKFLHILRKILYTEQLHSQLIDIRKQIDNLNNIKSKQYNILSKSIFIVGHARSGTTILLRALCTSPDIYLMGEANLYQNIWRNDFSSWYNNMHTEFDNKPERTTYLPELNTSNTTAWQVLEYLSKHFKYIGEKVAFSDNNGNQKDFFEFSLSNFLDGHYICIIRHPTDVIASCINKFYNKNFIDKEIISNIIISIYKTYELIMSIHKTFQNVYIISHENISQNTFDYLSQKLNTKLPKAYACYKPYNNNQYSNISNTISTHELYPALLHLHTNILSCINHHECSFDNPILLNKLYREKNILGDLKK